MSFTPVIAEIELAKDIPLKLVEVKGGSFLFGKGADMNKYRSRNYRT